MESVYTICNTHPVSCNEKLMYKICSVLLNTVRISQTNRTNNVQLFKTENVTLRIEKPKVYLVMK